MSSKDDHKILHDGLLHDCDGNPWSPASPHAIWVPATPALEEGELVWRGSERVIHLCPRYPSPGLLTQFIRLANAPDAKIQDFAKNWGMLSPEPLKTASDHAMRPEYWPAPGQALENVVDGWPNDEWREPLSAWRERSYEAQAIIAVATALRSGKFGRPEDWNRLYPAFTDDPMVWARVDEEQMTAQWKDHYLCLYLVRLRDTLARWIIEADVRPKLFIAERGSKTIALGGRGLLGALAVQLLFAVCRTQGLEVCSECGAAYVPKRKPAPGRLRYCEPCRKGRAPERHATAAHARRRADAYRLYMQGTLPRDISRTLDAPVWRIRKWIRAEREAAKRRLKPATKRRSARRE